MILDSTDLAFWQAENWPGDRSPYRVVIEPDLWTEYAVRVEHLPDEYIGRQRHVRDRQSSPSFRARVELWVPERRAFMGDTSLGMLWWCAGYNGTLAGCLEWAHREGKDMERQRDEILRSEQVCEEIYGPAIDAAFQVSTAGSVDGRMGTGQGRVVTEPSASPARRTVEAARPHKPASERTQ